MISEFFVLLIDSRESRFTRFERLFERYSGLVFVFQNDIISGGFRFDVFDEKRSECSGAVSSDRRGDRRFHMKATNQDTQILSGRSHQFERDRFEGIIDFRDIAFDLSRQIGIYSPGQFRFGL